MDDPAYTCAARIAAACPATPAGSAITSRTGCPMRNATRPASPGSHGSRASTATCESSRRHGTTPCRRAKPAGSNPTSSAGARSGVISTQPQPKYRPSASSSSPRVSTRADSASEDTDCPVCRLDSCSCASTAGSASAAWFSASTTMWSGRKFTEGKGAARTGPNPADPTKRKPGRVDRPGSGLKYRATCAPSGAACRASRRGPAPCRGLRRG